MTAMTTQREDAWMEHGRCRDTDPTIFVARDGEPDPPYPSPEALFYCNACPVRVECLAWGMKYDETGIWGGMTEYQRNQLKRPIERKKCPSCSSVNLVIERNKELCLSCGMSWDII